MTVSAARRGVAAAVLASTIVLGACADTEAKERAAVTTDVQSLPGDLVPSSLLGLAVTPEKVEGVEAAKRAYVEAVSLYGLREGEQLKATLQVSRFNEAAKPETAKFRSSILSKIGGSRPRQFRMGDTVVHFTTATKQTLAVWFRGDYLFVLAARDDYERPRTLVREALVKVQP